MDELRNATKHLHHQVDHHPLLAPLVAQHLSRAEYALSLRVLHGFIRRTEELIDACLAKGYRYERRMGALEQDLAQLNAVPFPFRSHIAPADSLDEALGYLYVLEGSRMGGKFIASRLSRIHPDYPRQFFDWKLESDNVEKHWQQFMQFVARQTKDHQTVTKAAQRLFCSLLEHLNTTHYQQQKHAA